MKHTLTLIPIRALLAGALLASFPGLIIAQSNIGEGELGQVMNQVRSRVQVKEGEKTRLMECLRTEVKAGANAEETALVAEAVATCLKNGGSPETAAALSEEVRNQYREAVREGWAKKDARSMLMQAGANATRETIRGAAGSSSDALKTRTRAMVQEQARSSRESAEQARARERSKENADGKTQAQTQTRQQSRTGCVDSGHKGSGGASSGGSTGATPGGKR
ncbi:MAG: hypothetical protein J0L75_06870 [Spirochaetes bacterium]|nr:hypothetical protein [Spirochaetota bacterium]